jgi:toxin ParE1/3/4
VIFRLTEQAEADVIGIYRYTAENFGLVQADAYHDRLDQTFHLLAAQPNIARERTELEPSVRVHPCGAHIIIYRIEADHLSIIRVRHGSEDWLQD